MTHKEMKAVLHLLNAVGETATDIFWGNDPRITDNERNSLSPEDFDRAYDEACLAYLTELEWSESHWLYELNSIMADRYGNEVRKRLLQKELEEKGTVE